MKVLSHETLASLLEPYYPGPDALLLDRLSIYLDLLLRWNARTNLSAIREPVRIVERHFGESLFTARQLPPGETLLDLGSGAGFPGLPIQLACPNLKVTLAESQNRKASFLREVVRVLKMPTEVFAARAETLEPRRFDIVTMRAVDDPQAARLLGSSLCAPGGSLVEMLSGPEDPRGARKAFPIPGLRTGWVAIFPVDDGTSQDVPRGTGHLV